MLVLMKYAKPSIRKFSPTRSGAPHGWTTVTR